MKAARRSTPVVMLPRPEVKPVNDAPEVLSAAEKRWCTKSENNPNAC